MKDYYAALGVTPHATEEEIAAAFRERTAAIDPARADDPAVQAAVQALVEAYEVLSNPTYRALYDAKCLLQERFPLPAALKESKLLRALRAGGSTFIRDLQEQYAQDPTLREDFSRSLRVGRTVAKAVRLLRFLR